MAEEDLESNSEQLEEGDTSESADSAVADAPVELVSGEDALVDQDLSTVSVEPEDPPEVECPPCKSGAPAWMATFADMATLLMAFFVLLLSFAETEVPKFKQVAGSLKAAFGIEKIVPKVTIPMARSLMAEDFTPAVAERSVQDVKEQRSDFVRGDFIEKKTEEGEFSEALQSDFEMVQEALEQELNKGLADVRVEDGEIKVTLIEQSMGGGEAASGGTGKGAYLPQEVLDAVAKISDLETQLESQVGVHLADKATGNASGASASRSSRSSTKSSGVSKYDRLRADLSAEIAAGLAEVEKD